MKLVAIYQKPADPDAFDRYFAEIHGPLAARMPGLRKMEVARVTGTPAGESELHQLVEMYFDSQADLQAAMASPEGQAAAKDLRNFAKGIIAMHIAQVNGTEGNQDG